MKYSQQQGFALIETMVAMLIIFIGLTAAFTAAQTSLQSSIRARDEVIAFYLAQEGFELIKNIRDSSVQGSGEWDEGFNGCTNPDRPCSIHLFSNGIESYVDSSDFGRLHISSGGDGGYYWTGSGERTRFVRTFVIQSVSDNEAKVDMKVEWTQGRDENQFTATEFITNWRQ